MSRVEKVGWRIVWNAFVNASGYRLFTCPWFGIGRSPAKFSWTPKFELVEFGDKGSERKALFVKWLGRTLSFFPNW